MSADIQNQDDYHELFQVNSRRGGEYTFVSVSTLLYTVVLVSTRLFRTSRLCVKQLALPIYYSLVLYVLI